MNAHSSQLGFTDYVAMVWTRRSTALFAAGLFACVTFIAFNFVPRRYAATCVFERQGNLISARTDGLPENFENLKPLLVHHTTGNEAVRQALDDLGYMDNLPADAAGQLTPDASVRLGRLVNSVQRNLHFSWIIRRKDRDRMSLRLTDGDPVLAYTLPNQLVKNYIASTQKELIAQLSTSATYLNQQIASADEKLDKLQEQRYNFLKGHPDMLPNNPQFLTRQIERLRTELEDLHQHRTGLDSRLASLKDIEINGMANTVVNPEHTEAMTAVTTLEAQLDDLRKTHTMTDRHPKVIRLTGHIAAAQATADRLPQRVEADMDPAVAAIGKTRTTMQIEDVRAEWARLTTQENRMTAALGRYTTAQANFLPVAREFGRITNRLGELDKEKRMWQENQVKVQRALAAEKNGTRTHLEVIRAAAPVYRPSWPALWHVFTLAIGGGLAFGVILVIMISRLSRCFDSAEEARTELGLPVLGVIGPILTPAARRVRAIRRYVLVPATVAVLLGVTFLAAAGVVMSTNYPGRYAQIIEHLAPTTRAMWRGVQSLLGLI